MLRDVLMEVSRRAGYTFSCVASRKSGLSNINSHITGNDANPETGAFARYIISKGDLVIRIPDAVTWEEAATVAVALITVGLALYHFLKLPLPGTDEKPIQESDAAPILIYGGSTATGTIAIQFAKL